MEAQCGEVKQSEISEFQYNDCRVLQDYGFGHGKDETDFKTANRAEIIAE